MDMLRSMLGVNQIVGLLPLKRKSHKMAQHTQTTRRQIVWPFYGVSA